MEEEQAEKKEREKEQEREKVCVSNPVLMHGVSTVESDREKLDACMRYLGHGYLLNQIQTPR